MVLGCDWLSAYNLIKLDFHKLRVSISLPPQKLILETLPQELLTKTLTAYSLTQQMSRMAQETRDGVMMSKKRFKPKEEALEILKLLQQ